MRLKRIALAAAVALAAAALTFWLGRPPAPPSATDAAAPSPTAAPAPVPVPIPAPAQAPADRMTEQLSNPLERSTDLRAVYARYKDSANPNERHIAYRAWSACFPTFIGPQGQAVSLDSVTAGVARNAADTASRVDAYRALMGRCKGFADIPREQLLAETARQKAAVSSGAALAPGELAARYLGDGDTARAIETARAVLVSRDAAAIDSLREFVNQVLVQQVDAQRAAPDERPDLRALAFGLAACRLGLDCGADTLTALQQCASSGACSGSVADRYVQSVAEADRARLAQETDKVLRAVASGDITALGW